MAQVWCAQGSRGKMEQRSLAWDSCACLARAAPPGNKKSPERFSLQSCPKNPAARAGCKQPGDSELKVVADLTAADKSGIAQGQNIGGARGVGKRLRTRRNCDAGRGCHIDRIALSEGVAGIQTCAEAGPGEDRRRRRYGPRGRPSRARAAARRPSTCRAPWRRPMPRECVVA